MPRKSNRGFAAMDAKRHLQIASMGGRAAHEQGTAHEFTPREAREAGRRGGEAVSRDREHMAEIGARGGRMSHGGRGRTQQRGSDARSGRSSNSGKASAAGRRDRSYAQASSGRGRRMARSR